MKLSVIIPAYNTVETIRECLAAVYASTFTDFEVLLADDASRDRTVSIAGEFPCRILRQERQGGAARARNVAARQACGEILVFLDSDVRIYPDTLTKIAENFSGNADLAALTGLLSRGCPYPDFFSQFKNLYMNFIFRQCPREVDFLYGSLAAVRRRDFMPFDESLPMTDDTDLGQRLKKSGKIVVLDHALEVVHLKRYTFGSMVRNDFLVPFWWARSFIRHRGVGDVILRRGFSHARWDQLSGIALAYMFLLALVIRPGTPSWAIPAACAALLSAVHFRFLRFLSAEKGKGFLGASAGFIFIDDVVMGMGITAGLVYFAVFKKKTETPAAHHERKERPSANRGTDHGKAKETGRGYLRGRRACGMPD